MKLSSLDGKKYDVIVCGLGSGGFAAACAAGKAGARVLALERYGFGGGILTAAMIHTFDAIKSCADNSKLVVGGIPLELIEEIRALGGEATDDNPSEALTVDPEVQKVAMDRMLARYGVDVIFYGHVCDALMEGKKVVGVEAALRDGRARFYAPNVVDGTGDAEIAFYADAPWTLDKELQALTSHFRLGNVAKGFDWQTLEAATRPAMEAAKAAGEINVYGGPWVIRLTDGEISINAARVYGNPTDPVELSRAEIEGRKSAYAIARILKKRVPQFKDSYVLSGCTQLHIRESRIIDGEYKLTEEDIRKNAAFDDAIAIGAWPVDIHPTNGFSGVHPHKESPPLPYEIPFRCLLPKGVDGLAVCGKPISTTHRAHGSTRVPGTSLATGQAAGAACALSAKLGVPLRQVPAEALQRLLREQGALPRAADVEAAR